MATIFERFAMIEESVMREARKKVSDINQRESDFRETALKKAEEEIQHEMYNKIEEEVTEIRMASTRTVAQKETKYRQELLLRREEITTEVFGKVELALKQYTKTDEYKKMLLDTARDIAEKYPLEGGTVMLRGDDYPLAIQLNKIFSEKCRIVVDSDIHIGGIRMMNQTHGIFVDESLDYRLKSQKPWFYSNSGLQIN